MSREPWVTKDEMHQAIVVSLVIGWSVGAGMVLIYFGWIGIVGCQS